MWLLADLLCRPCPVRHLIHGLCLPVTTHAAKTEALSGLKRQARCSALASLLHGGSAKQLDARAGIGRAERRSKLGHISRARATYLCNMF